MTFSSLDYAVSPHTVRVCWLTEELYCCTPRNRQRPTQACWVDQHCLEDSGPLPFISGPSLRQSDVRPVFQHLARVSLLCFSVGRAFFLWLWSVHPATLWWTSFTNLLLNVNQKLVVRERSLHAVFNQMLKEFCFGRTLIFYYVKDGA